MLDNVLVYSLDYYTYSFLEDIFVTIMFYSLTKLIVLSSVVELIWPTQFFNRRHASGVTTYRLRTYTEVLTKLRGINLLLPVLFITTKLNFIKIYVF